FRQPRIRRLRSFTMPLEIKNIEAADGSNFAYNDRVVMGAQFNLVNNSSPGAIASVAVDAAGSYESLPVIGTTGNGSGATLVAKMKALTAVVAAAGTGYLPGDTITLTGGTFTTAAVMTIDTSKLVSAAV